MTATPSSFVGVKDLKVAFPIAGHGTLKAVDGVSFDIRERETLGVIGESGSGKTTLGRTIACLLKPTSGQVRHGPTDPNALGARALRQHRRHYQIIFQDPHAALNPRMTMLQSVREPLDIMGDGTARERDREAMAALDRVGLGPQIASRYAHEISGGQKQRVNIARTLTLKPSFIVCDEVVAALDVSIRGDILNLFTDLQREFGLTYLFITHDLSVVSHISDRIAVMYLGKLVEMAPTQTLMERPLHPYTEALLSAEPIPLPAAMRTGERIRLEGEIPSPVDPPSGCRFRTRCGFATDLCAQREPAWREHAAGHWAACHFAGTVTAARS